MKKNEKLRLMCIAYLSTEGSLYEIQRQEDRQLKYLREYAKANNIDICLLVRRKGMGQIVINRQWEVMANLVSKGKADGILIANTETISSNVPDVFYKIGQIYEAGGIVISVDEGRLSMPVKRMQEGRMVLVNERV